MFGKLKGRVRRPVAVVAVLGPLNRELVGNRKVQAFVGQSLNGLFNCCFEIFRSHRVNDITPVHSAANQVWRHRLSRERASLLGHPGASLLLEGLCVRRRLGNPGAGRTIASYIDMRQYRCVSIQDSVVVGSGPAVYTDGVQGTELMEATANDATPPIRAHPHPDIVNKIKELPA